MELMDSGEIAPRVAVVRGIFVGRLGENPVSLAMLFVFSLESHLSGAESRKRILDNRLVSRHGPGHYFSGAFRAARKEPPRDRRKRDYPRGDRRPFHDRARTVFDPDGSVQIL